MIRFPYRLGAQIKKHRKYSFEKRHSLEQKIAEFYGFASEQSIG